MTTVASELWSLIPGGRQVDPTKLATAVVKQIDSGDLDFRTRLLIRDSLNALASHWGGDRLSAWIDGTGRREQIERIRREELGEPGFPSLAWRVMATTSPQTILQFLRELGARVRGPVRIEIGGSTALIMPGLLSRMTDDIDVVDELPAAIRGEHAVLEDLTKRYGIRLAHFQSHYLPDGWDDRLHSLGKFREIEAFLVDPYDVCVSKLFSHRSKDLDDLRHLRGQLDKDVLRQRLVRAGARLRREERLHEAAETNWYVLFGEALPG
jgi:hypothetical protein